MLQNCNTLVGQILRENNMPMLNYQPLGFNLDISYKIDMFDDLLKTVSDLPELVFRRYY